MDQAAPDIVTIYIYSNIWQKTLFLLSSQYTRFIDILYNSIYLILSPTPYPILFTLSLRKHLLGHKHTNNCSLYTYLYDGNETQLNHWARGIPISLIKIKSCSHIPSADGGAMRGTKRRQNKLTIPLHKKVDRILSGQNFCCRFVVSMKPPRMLYHITTHLFAIFPHRHESFSCHDTIQISMPYFDGLCNIKYVCVYCGLLLWHIISTWDKMMNNK